eukprot:CFRG6000T1
MSTVRCDVCAEPACRACPCLNRFFCSDECQSVDWHELGHHVTCSGAPAQAVESSRAVRARTSRSTRSPQKSIARKSEFTNEKQINTATNTGETEKRRLRSRKPSNRHTQTSDGRSMGTLGEHTPSTSSFVYTSSTRPFTDLKDFHSTNTSTRVSTRSSRSIVSRYESQAKNIDHSAADDGLGPFTTSTLPQATLDTTSIASVPASPLTIPTSVHQTFHCNQTSDTHEASRIVGDGEGSSDYAENEASSFPNLGRPYACEWPTCSLTFTMPSSLTSHARTHDKHGLDGHGTEAVTCQNEYTGTRTTYQKKARIRSAGYVSDPEGADNPVIRIDTGRMSKRKRKMSGRTVVQSSINDAISSCEFTTCPDNIVVAEATVSIRSLSENETKAIDDSPNSLIDESRIQLTTRKRKSYYSASDTPLRSMSNVGETTIDEHDGDDVVYRDSLCADSEIQTAEDTALSPPTRNIQNTTDGTTAKFLSLTSRKGTSHSDNVVIVEENPAKPGPGRRSNNAREYQCTREDCDKRYAQKADLTFHMKSHSRQSLLYECEWEGCEKVFSKASHLEYHIPAHTGERRDVKNLLEENQTWSRTYEFTPEKNLSNARGLAVTKATLKVVRSNLTRELTMA